MTVDVAPGATGAFTLMLSDLVRQNLESKPKKLRDLAALGRFGKSVALVADDAEVAVTLEFTKTGLVMHDGIRGIPDVTVRGTSDAIMALSNVPIAFGLPIPTDRAAVEAMREMVQQSRSGEIVVHGMLGHFRVLARLTRLMSVNG